jgi:hypothetical protein
MEKVEVLGKTLEIPDYFDSIYDNEFYKNPLSKFELEHLLFIKVGKPYKIYKIDDNEWLKNSSHNGYIFNITQFLTGDISPIMDKLSKMYPNYDIRKWFGFYSKRNIYMDISLKEYLEYCNLIDLKFFLKNYKKPITEEELEILFKEQFIVYKFNFTIVQDYQDIIPFLIKKEKIIPLALNLAKRGSKYLHRIYQYALPKKNPKNLVSWCIKKRFYPMLEFVNVSKIQWDEAKDLIIRNFQKMIPYINKNILDKIEPFIEWEKYSKNAQELKYSIRKEMVSYISITTDSDVIKFICNKFYYNDTYSFCSKLMKMMGEHFYDNLIEENKRIINLIDEINKSIDIL